ncbi:MAG: hypothetical protein K0V04_30030 [Deltaproteobacteria bacterium]|nr:hypothetical protein [Deltaproteobacteria bacterium]
MLNIRPQQIEAMMRPQRQSYYEALCDEIRAAHRAATHQMSDQELAALARDGRLRALAYGLRTKTDAVRFVGLQLALGRDFDGRREHAGAAAELRGGDGPPSARLERLMTRVLGSTDTAQAFL